MKQQDFISTCGLEDRITNRKKNKCPNIQIAQFLTNQNNKRERFTYVLQLHLSR